MTFRESSSVSVLDDAGAVEALAPSVRDVLESLEQNGRLTPHDVLDEARHPDSPLHARFNWDDESAAESWRLEQARRLIRSVQVRITIEETHYSVPMRVRDPGKSAHEAGYVGQAVLREDPDAARKMLRYEFDRVLSLVTRAAVYAHAVGLDGDVDALRASVSKLLKKLR